MKTLNDGGVLRGDAIAERFGAVSGGDPGRVKKIFAAPGNAVERAAICSSGDFRVGFFRLREGEIARESDDAAELRVELFDAIKIDMREALGSESALLDPSRKLGDRSIGDLGVARRERAGIGIAADEAVALGGRMLAGKYRVVARKRCHRGFDGNAARAGAAFQKRRHVHAPGVSGLRAFGGSKLNANEFFSFRESRGRNFGTHRGTGPEGGRRAGREL